MIIPPIDAALAMVVLREHRDWTLAQLAIEMLCAGHDSPMLRQCAASVGDYYDKDELRLLVRALDELGIALPTRDEAVACLAGRAALDIVEGRAAPYEGARRICELAWESDSPRSLHPFIYAEDVWCDHPDTREAVEQGIRDAARTLLSETTPRSLP